MLPGLPGMITLANQRDDNWPINKYQETPAANQPLPTPCLCSKLINTAVHLGSGLLFYSTVLDVTGALARASNKPLHAFALLWTSYSLSFGDSDTGHNMAGRFFTNRSTWEASVNYKASQGAAELEAPDWELLGGAPGKTSSPERQEVAALIPLLHPHDGRVSFFILLSQLLRRP